MCQRRRYSSATFAALTSLGRLVHSRIVVSPSSVGVSSLKFHTAPGCRKVLQQDLLFSERAARAAATAVPLSSEGQTRMLGMLATMKPACASSQPTSSVRVQKCRSPIQACPGRVSQHRQGQHTFALISVLPRDQVGYQAGGRGRRPRWIVLAKPPHGAHAVRPGAFRCRAGDCRRAREADSREGPGGWAKPPSLALTAGPSLAPRHPECPARCD